MRDKVVLVTGGNAGIGRGTSQGLAQAGANVVVVSRDEARGEAAVGEIRAQTGSSAVSLLAADLSTLAGVRRLAADFQRRVGRLDVLINNAAIIPLRRQVTPDGLELQFAVNYLAAFLLTSLLLDLLQASPSGRVVNVSSQVHQWGKLNFDDLQSEQRYDRTDVYAMTKLANVLFTYELARRLQGSNVTANCLHPGVIATRLSANYSGRNDAGRVSLAEWLRGAETSIYLASSAEVEGVSGLYYVNSRQRRSSAASYDRAAAERLWRVSDELCGRSDDVVIDYKPVELSRPDAASLRKHVPPTHVD